jgi:hypothetical protein
MDEIITGFRAEYDDETDMVGRSGAGTVQERLKSWFHTLDTAPEIWEIVQELQDEPQENFDDWYNKCRRRDKGGAARLLWPEEEEERVVRRRPLAAGASSAPASPAGGGPPASAVFISGELAPLRSSPLGSASFSSVSSIRVFSRQAPGHGGPQRGLRSAQELVARVHREGVGCGRLRSVARCLYLVMCPARARARWPRGRPGWPPRVARHVRSGRFGGGTGRFHPEWPLRQPRHQGW